jgi:phosphate acyltransferase
MSTVVAVDAMGGDDAPRAIVEGAIAAARSGISITLVGPEARVRAECDRHPDAATLPITLVDSDEAVSMEETPLAALRRRPRASIRVAADIVGAGDAEALLSAGHTGAAFLAAHAAFGMLRGVDRPALAVTVPTRGGMAVLLDAGANPECRPEHLLQFGLMGSAYARVAFGLEHPRVGVLSIGEEAAKGTDLTREAHALLAGAPVTFIGNLEARDLFSGRADVIVCDGFTGNVALKVGEGLAEFVGYLLREELGSLLAADADLRGAMARFSKRVDPTEHGAAPLLGVAKLALVAHGRSSARAVASGIALAARLAREGVVTRLAQALSAQN